MFALFFDELFFLNSCSHSSRIEVPFNVIPSTSGIVSILICSSAASEIRYPRSVNMQISFTSCLCSSVDKLSSSVQITSLKLESEFDPNFHNAVMQVESEEYESGVIAQELQKGYTYRDSVVRHSMVAVVS